MTKNKGFTLIELLVVIAIIGILASIVLVSLGGARDKAKDARAVGDISQIRNKAELVYAADGAYTNLSCTYDTEMTNICNDVNAQVKADPTIVTHADDYCVYVKVNTQVGGADSYYCVDSSGIAKETATNPGGTAGSYCEATAGTYICP